MQRISLTITPKFSTKIELKSISKFIDDSKINFYVEDKNKANYYETLLSTIYPKHSDKIRIIDTNRGKKIFKYVNLLSKYQLKNQLANSNIKLKYNNFIDFQTTNIDILKLVKELRIISKKYKDSNFSSAKYNYNCIKDINGKRFFELLLSWCTNTDNLKINLSQENFMNLILSAYLKNNKNNNFKRFSRELDKIFNNI